MNKLLWSRPLSLQRGNVNSRSFDVYGKYIPSACGGIKWDDTTLKIPWPLKEYGIEKVIVTEKDAMWPTFEEYLNKVE